MVETLRTKPKLVAAIIYLAVFMSSLFVPEVVNNLLTGSAGPNTRFLATVILSPVAFLTLGARGGIRLFTWHAVLVVLLAVWAWLTYPNHPPMNFTRQIAHDLPPALGAMYALGWGIGVAGKTFSGRRRRNRIDNSHQQI